MIADVQAVLLAGGMAKRFNSGKTNLTEKLCGKELILYPLSLLKSLNIPTTIVVGFQANIIKKTVESNYPNTFSYIEQPVQDGTAHAVQLSKPTWNQQDILIMKADVPLLKKELIEVKGYFAQFLDQSQFLQRDVLQQSWKLRIPIRPLQYLKERRAMFALCQQPSLCFPRKGNNTILNKSSFLKGAFENSS